MRCLSELWPLTNPDSAGVNLSSYFETQVHDNAALGALNTTLTDKRGSNTLQAHVIKTVTFIITTSEAYSEVKQTKLTIN